jgi:hypothetical protein
MCGRTNRVAGRRLWHGFGFGWLIALLLLGGASPGVDPAPQRPATEGARLIVKFNAQAAPAERKALHERLGGKLLKVLRGAERTEVVVFPSKHDAAMLIKGYQQSGLVEYAEVDGVVHALDGKPEV